MIQSCNTLKMSFRGLLFRSEIAEHWPHRVTPRHTEMAAQIAYASARAPLRVHASASEQNGRLIRPNAVTRPALRAGARVGGFSGNIMAAAAEPEQIEKFLDGLKYDDKDLVVAIAQDVDTGAILMQGFADRTAVRTTMAIVHDFLDGDGRCHHHRRIGIGLFWNEGRSFCRSFRRTLYRSAFSASWRLSHKGFFFCWRF